MWSCFSTYTESPIWWRHVFGAQYRFINRGHMQLLSYLHRNPYVVIARLSIAFKSSGPTPPTLAKPRGFLQGPRPPPKLIKLRVSGVHFLSMRLLVCAFQPRLTAYHVCERTCALSAVSDRHGIIHVRSVFAVLQVSAEVQHKFGIHRFFNSFPGILCVLTSIL